ncbi:DNA polymerase V [Arthrobacter sp. GAS37]|uniref:LexA family protein n=1 Tax=Arthrobacter sp. GAS37 TaxID=3156261 RepID=UPI00383342BD
MSVTVLGRVESVAGALRMAPSSVPAGFPSPAQDYYDGPVSLDEHLVRDRAATFFLRVSGESMEGAGISDDDVVIVDRSVKARHGDIVVAVLDGDMTLKRLEITAEGVRLVAANPDYPPIVVGLEADFRVWGTATICLHQLGNQRVLRAAG